MSVLAALIAGIVISTIVAWIAGWNHFSWMEDDEFRDPGPAPAWIQQAFQGVSPRIASEYRSGAVGVACWEIFRREPYVDRMITRTRWGWPCLAVESRRIDDIREGSFIINPFRQVSTFDVPEWVPRLVPQHLPWRPVWPGFAVNAFFFGCATAALWFTGTRSAKRLVMVVRRKMMKHRGGSSNGIKAA